MLPGFRFLFAAILLSVSILVFGLGAAALLRATHEEFVSNPSWRNGPQEQVFAQVPEPAHPVLAVLRAEPAAAAPARSLRDDVPTIALPVNDPQQGAGLTQDAAATAGPTTAEARPTDITASEPAMTDTAAAAPSEQANPAVVVSSEPAPPTAAPPDTTTSLTASDIAVRSPTDTQQPDTTAAPATPEIGSTTKVAALSDPIEDAGPDPAAQAKSANGTPETKATKRRADRPKKRHHIVQRPPPPAPVQQTFNLFGQLPTYATTARTR
jgi:hypothetical protein